MGYLNKKNTSKDGFLEKLKNERTKLVLIPVTVVLIIVGYSLVKDSMQDFYYLLWKSTSRTYGVVTEVSMSNGVSGGRVWEYSILYSTSTADYRIKASASPDSLVGVKVNSKIRVLYSDFKPQLATIRSISQIKFHVISAALLIVVVIIMCVISCNLLMGLLK